ncbi:MAG: transcription antitermination factor NusB [Bacilli bacterium]|nr:transcription antitermination factor NusB [Bacilli bacterium]
MIKWISRKGIDIMKRNETRVLAMQCLYNYSVSKVLDIDSILEMNEDLKEYDKDYLNELITIVINHLSDIDYEIAKCLDNYSIDRLNLVDLNLIRIAIAEVSYLNIPINIAINECLEISKLYSETEDTKTSKFNNALLDKIFIDLGFKDGK